MSAITCVEVGKRYRQTADAPTLVQRLAASARGRRAREVWAVRDLDLTVARGETVGVIGRNGAGKTTMLQLLAGVTAPSTGRVRVEGAVAPLIGVGVGFHPELTGRENVALNARILGLTATQTAERFESIHAFSELGDAVEMPVKFYSSGMFLRLAFAVAVHTEPEVLLVDEVLAVGDLAFQVKCLARMREMQAAGTTTVIVTHDLGLVQRTCERVVVMQHGRKAFDGDTDEGLAVYHELLHVDPAARDAAAEISGSRSETITRAGGGAVRLTLLDASEEPTDVLHRGTRATLVAELTPVVDVTDPVVGIAVRAEAAGALHLVHTIPGEYRGRHGPGNPVRVEASFDVPLMPGRYSIACNMRHDERIVASSRPLRFSVVGADDAGGVLDLEARLVP